MTQTALTPAMPRHFSLREPRHTALSKSRSADRFWPVLRDLIEARQAFGLRRPVLATLRALISFLEEGSTVFASNRSITARAEGISESALRRHIKALTDLGLIARRDSSNGKRYRLEAEGQEDLVFGIDLAPLAAAEVRIADLAEDCRRENRLMRQMRKRLGQLIYTARLMGRPDPELDPYQKALRQKLSSADYEMLCASLAPTGSELSSPAQLSDAQPAAGRDLNLIEEVSDSAQSVSTSKMTGSDSQNDCHKNITEERSLNLVGVRSARSSLDDSQDQAQPLSEIAPDEALSAFSDHGTHSSEDSAAGEPALLRKARALAPDALAFAEATPRNWQEVEALAWRLASWSGISPKLLSAAIEAAGERMTAMAVLLVTQNSGRIRNPGAYFRTLTMGRHFPRFSRPLAHLH